MRVLAIDYGTVRIGLALSDPTGTLARPLDFLPVPAQMGEKAERKLARSVLEIATKEKAERLLIGVPRHMNGDWGPEADRVKAFAAKIQEQTKLPLEFCDERLSTVQATRQLHEAGRDSRAQRTRIDSAAAAVLLQAWLDAKRPLLSPPESE
jgi:putative Holliday junction resolvase